MPQFLHPCLERLALTPEHIEPLVYRVVAFQHEIYIPAYLLQRHSSFFHAADHPEPLYIAFAEHPYPVGICQEPPEMIPTERTKEK